MLRLRKNDAAVLKAYGWPTDLTEPEIVSRLFAMYEKLLMLYFRVGAYISANSRKCKWGSGAIDSISNRLQQELPGLRGFSATNIKSMRLFFEAWLGGVVTAANRQLPTADLDALPEIRQLPTAELSKGDAQSFFCRRLYESSGNPRQVQADGGALVLHQGGGTTFLDS